jgi:8-oxo-dGTP pyrophosphatase MutT (NUDIX family)
VEFCAGRHVHARSGQDSEPMTEPAGSDRWTFCPEGHIHWGAHGGAGLLLRHVPLRGDPVYLLAERSRWADEGGTWGIPGGAIHDGESREAAARRETAEEIWPVPANRVRGIDVQDCGGGWKFRIVRADVDAPFTAYAASQTDATGWFTLSEMAILRLHPGFRQWVEDHTQPDG